MSGLKRNETSETGGESAAKAVEPATGSVFKDGVAPEAKPSTEHKGVHGTDGGANDLDRAEDAGREGGRR